MNENIEEKNITVNRKAQHDYFIKQKFEAGIVLVGTEVKALRENKASIVDSYAIIQNDEVWLINSNIATYDQGSYNNHEPFRKRKLLLKKNEIRKLKKAIEEKGNTLIPLRMYFKNGKVKVELALATGKRKYDKRESIAKKDLNREMQRKLRQN
ncbi:SsrA-binding protein SmpB [Rosettibacter firmus]|uniref:SsrA-binding protein SmpB n=1 Tax=Rosettibacter firmus TaxID=3111522 RepID=UPI00336BFFCF